MTEAILLGLSGDPDVKECAYVESDVVPGLDYFASKVRLGPNGVEEIFGLGALTETEQKAVEALKPLLLTNIKTGVEFANA